MIDVIRIIMGDYKHINISSIIQIGNWPSLDEPLAGSRVKTTVAEPETENLYIFKYPKEGREAQIWSELIASYIAGDLLGWPVQHAAIAMRRDKIGNLLRYIYDVHADPKKPSETFHAGEQFCKHVDTNYDPIQGKRHTWDLIRKIHDDFLAYNKDGKFFPKVSNMYNIFWVRTVAFDTLISNTDRHAENWALLTKPSAYVRMAPFYDNGSSLGCENSEATLRRKWFDSADNLIEEKVKSYASKGAHHLRDRKDRFKFEDLALQVLKEFPDMRSEYEAIAQLDLAPIERLLTDIMSIKGLPVAAQITPRRSAQVMALLQLGQSRIKRCLEKVK